MMKRLLVITLIGMILSGCANTSSLSGDVYHASEAKQVRAVTYGTIVSLRPVQIQAGDENGTMGAISGAVLGGFLGNTIGCGTSRSLATAAGAVAGSVAGQRAQGAINRFQGVELEIRRDDGTTIVVVQRQGNTCFSMGQRVAMSSNGQKVTVAPR
ncbi:MAG: glycine zipper 2TM domain-containing protein [Symbiopectobacterium sp.]